MTSKTQPPPRLNAVRGDGTDPLPVPFWLPLGLFVAVTVVLFADFVFSDGMLYGEDNLSLGYMARAFFIEHIRAGDFPLWNPTLLGGVPLVEAIGAADAIYPTSLLFLFGDPHRMLGWRLILHVLAAGFFMYGWTRSLGLGRAAATVAGLAWLMAPVMVTLVLPGNDGKLMVASLTPLVFWAAEAVLHRPDGRSLASLAGAVAVTCLTTQFQTAYFLFGSVGAYAAFRVVRLYRTGRFSARDAAGEGSNSGRKRPSVIAGYRFCAFLGASVLGAGIAAVQVLPSAQYVTEYSRRVATTVDATPAEAMAYASSWSFHPEEVVALAVPEFVGNTAGDAEWARGTYWGRNALKLNHEYLGITVIALALAGMFGRRNRGLRWFMAVMSATWLLFALGAHTPVWRIFYEVVPGISLFRVPAICAFLISFGVSTLCALGVDDLLRSSGVAGGFLRSRRGKALLGLVGVLLAGTLLHASGALISLWTTVIYPEISGRALAALTLATPHITRGFGITLLLAGLATVVIWGRMEGKLSLTATCAALLLLVAFDLGRVDRAFIRSWDFHTWASPDANARFLQNRAETEPPFRVADLRGNDQNVELGMHGLELVTGHHPNDLARYRTLIGLEGSRASGANTRHPNVLSMLNVKYVVWPFEAAGGAPFAGAQALSSAAGRSGVEAVYAYPGLGRAWLVRNFTVADDDAALTRILSRGFDPAREAILAEPFEGLVPVDAGPAAAGVIRWEVNDPDHRRMFVRTDGPALLVFSENWFPGWTADVNGNEVTVRRANVTLQAIPIREAGDHVVTLRFTAPTVMRALAVSGVAAAITLLLASSLVRRRLLPRQSPNTS